MLLMIKFVCFMVLHFILAQSQINLDFTDNINDTGNDIVWQHDCLHVAAEMEYPEVPLQIISYCLSEWASKWNIQENNFDQKLTFADLFNLGITNQQLYLWSAPMDIIEHYQFYLNQISTSNDVSFMDKQIFYNCTLPRFGPLCQYSFDGYESSNLSLTGIVRDFYSFPYVPITMTCYMHLDCNRGSTDVCLDWTEVCDGEVDCLNDGVDEKYCWQLMINECDVNEYRCKDGACIPETFRDDGRELSYDCLDGSDESTLTAFSLNERKTEPIFAEEDVRCFRDDWVKPALTSSCVPQRTSLLLNLILSNKQEPISDNCWYAFQCHFGIPDYFQQRCSVICPNRSVCLEIINNTCPDMLFIPNTPVIFGHVYLAYTKQAAQNPMPQGPTYICYNDQLCSGFLRNKTTLSFNNLTCRRPKDFPVTFFVPGTTWLAKYVGPLYRFIFQCNTIITNNNTGCNNSLMYQCVNSSKCIPYHKVGDDNIDCDYKDDEKQTVIDTMCLNDRLNMFFNCTSINKCIHKKKLRDEHCHCGKNEYGLCDDEDPIFHHLKKDVIFSSTCDGFTDLIPVLINGRNETDETECELWECNNTYTRCNGFWNCWNGADEIDCKPSSLLYCPQQHMCISVNSNQMMCLPVKNGTVSSIDCLYSINKAKICRSDGYLVNHDGSYCSNRPSKRCVLFQQILRPNLYCDSFYQKDNCYQYVSFTFYSSTDTRICLSTDYSIETFVYQHEKVTERKPPIHFSLDTIEKGNTYTTLQDANKMIQHSKSIQHNQRCHRGLPLLVWIDKEKHLTNTTCLCPPSFYGNVCQYQNQRISLSLKFQAYLDSQRTLFGIVSYLIDNSDERIIHSYQQFTFLYVRDCHLKFDNYFLYSTRPKDNFKNYSIHIDIYEKISLVYRGSIFIPIKFSFLPVYRISTLINIPPTNEEFAGRSDPHCIHGRCMKYSNDRNDTTFCQCNPGWSGQNCSIRHTCNCSDGSICIGVSVNNRSICVCPMNKFGSRCLLDNTICQSNPCSNNGQCISLDEHRVVEKKYSCICRKGFMGDRCEIDENKIILSFDKNIVVPQTMTVHFIQVMKNANSENGSIFVTNSIYQKTIIIHWTHPFHIAFIELSNKIFYLIIVQNPYTPSKTITRRINPIDRCKRLSELLNTSIVESHLVRRIKYYHLVCQKYAPLLSCFTDAYFFCLCTNFAHRRLANCFEFDQTKKFDCFGQNNCKNGAECLQDKLTCPQTSMCICPTCFYGRQCQFSSDGFGLSLDGILGYHIQPHLSMTYQPLIVKISLSLTIIIAIGGFINSIAMMITFKNRNSRQVGCGLYLLYSSINDLITITLFPLKFSILFIAQSLHLTNRFFLYSQCISIDFILRSGLQLDQWLHACLMIERAMNSIKGATFNKGKSKRIAAYIAPLLVFLITLTNIPDPFHRHLINDDDNEESKRIWCIVVYPSTFKLLNSYVNIFHSFMPFIINVITTIIIIITTVRRRITLQNTQRYSDMIIREVRQHSHLFTSSIILIILALPRLIMSFVSGCMKSTDDYELFLAGYFISFIPSTLTFIVFVLPSKTYKDEFWLSIKQYRTRIGRYLNRN